MKMAAERGEKALARWQRIAKEAVKQSGQTEQLEIFPVSTLEKSLQSISDDEHKVVFHPSSDAFSFSDWIDSLKSSAKKPLHLFFGPEGGFDAEEVERRRELKKYA